MKQYAYLFLAMFAAGILTGCSTTENNTASKGGWLNKDFQTVINDAKDKVFPAVVFIKALHEDMQMGQKISTAISGSGVIISANGEVLTNWHVINKGSGIRCLLYDGRAYDAELIGADKDTDVALIKLKIPEGDKPVPCARILEQSNVNDGDFVMAMGAPWSLNRSISIGIISCSRRFLPGKSEYSLWYQTDAAISPGNSGGPLVNTDGYVIGINTLGMMSGGDMGFAVPSATIMKVIPRLRQYGSVNWAWTGLQLQPLKDFNRNIYFNADSGVVVAGTDPESPARRAGIEARDRILKINGIPVTATTEEEVPAIKQMLGLLPLGKKVELEIARNGKNLTLQLTPREKGKVEGEEIDCPRWDITVKSINQFDNPELYFYQKQGVFIYGIKEPGNALRSGLMRNDIILKVDNKAINSLADFKEVYEQTMQDIKNRPRVTLSVMRSGLFRQIILDFSRDFEKE